MDVLTVKHFKVNSVARFVRQFASKACWVRRLADIWGRLDIGVGDLDDPRVDSQLDSPGSGQGENSFGCFGAVDGDDDRAAEVVLSAMRAYHENGSVDPLK